MPRTSVRSRAGVAVLVATIALAAASPAHADRLHVPPEAPLWQHIGAALLLILHVGGGTVGLFAGATALLTRKGGRVHRAAGAVFLVSMLLMAGVATAVSPSMQDRVNVVAGFVTFYLVLTGFTAARRREGIGAIEIIGLFVAIAGAVYISILAWMASRTPEGTLDGAPPQAFFVFVLVTVIAAASDLKVVLRRGISGAQRIARHVWRMTFSLFVASGSLFLGQSQMFPDWLQSTPVLIVAGLAPLPFLVFWMLRVRLTRKFA